MKHLRTYSHTVLVSLAAAAALCSCSDDPYTDEQGAMLNLCSLGNTHIEGYTDQQHRAPAMAFAHRAPGDPDNHSFVPGTPEDGQKPEDVHSYLPYNELYPKPINREYTTIGAFLTEDTKGLYNNISGTFSYAKDNSWRSTVGVRPGDYFLFGYMPANLDGATATLSKRTGTWADGATLHIENLSTVTPADVCVTVGALKWNDKTTPIYDPAVVAQLKQGVYNYRGDETDNYAYLLLDHLYTNVNFELSVEPKYAELRTIVLKKVTMKSAVSNTVTADITLGKDSKQPLEGTTFQATSAPPAAAVLFPEESQYETPVSTDPIVPTSIPGYFAPGMTDQSFVFEFIYDVYDQHNIDATHPYGNLVRGNCHAVNRWAITGGTVAPGKSFKVKAILKPTYLYQLSEPDLDNPSIEFEAPEGTTIQATVNAELLGTMPGENL